MTVVTLDAPPVNAKNLLRCWLVPGLLCVVATLHLVRVYALDQSAWGAGCGFGMFSKVDYHGSRIQRCEDFQAKVLPTDRNLQRLANAVAATQWSLRPSPANSNGDLHAVKHHASKQADPMLLEPAASHRAPVIIDRIRVEQWRVRFHADEQTLRTWKAKVAETQPSRKAAEVQP